MYAKPGPICSLVEMEEARAASIQMGLDSIRESMVSYLEQAPTNPTFFSVEPGLILTFDLSHGTGQAPARDTIPLDDGPDDPHRLCLSHGAFCPQWHQTPPRLLT